MTGRKRSEQNKPGQNGKGQKRAGQERKTAQDTLCRTWPGRAGQIMERQN